MSLVMLACGVVKRERERERGSFISIVNCYRSLLTSYTHILRVVIYVDVVFLQNNCNQILHRNVQTLLESLSFFPFFFPLSLSISVVNGEIAGTTSSKPI